MENKCKKYPRTPHLPHSKGISNDDRIIESLSLLDEHITITTKKDGSNVCLTRDSLFARSHSGPPTHSSFDLLKQIWAQKRHSLDDYELFGEWLYAKHSIKYTNLPSYLQIFNIRKNGIWLSRDDVWAITEYLGFVEVPVLEHEVIMNLQAIEELAEEVIENGEEGIVVRVSREFSEEEFPTCVAKYVRKDHVQTSEHWTNQQIEKNELLKQGNCGDYNLISTRYLL